LDGHDGASLRVLKPNSNTSVNVYVRQANGIVAIGGFGTTWIFKADGTQLRAIPGASAGGLSTFSGGLSLDGKVLVSGGPGGIHRFDVASGAELSPSLQVPPLGDAGVDYFGYVAISPDGALVAASGVSSGVYLWSTIDGAQVAHVASGQSLALSTTELAVGSEQGVTVYSLTGAMLSQYRVDGQQTPFMTYSPDGTKLAYTMVISSGPWMGAKVVKIIDRPSGVEAATLFEDRQALEHSNGKVVALTGVAFIDGAVAVGWSDRRVTLFGAADGVPIWSRILDE
jgi:hypothetical protein